MTPHDENGREDSLGLGAMLAGDPPADVQARLRESMRLHWNELEQIDATTVAASPFVVDADPARRRRRRGYRMLQSLRVVSGRRIAACVALLGGVAAIVAMLLMNGGATSAYAQAVEAVQGAQSVHARGYRTSNGQLALGIEVWYSPTQGVREQALRPGREQVRIDDREHEWVYREATKTVVQGKTRDAMGVMRKMLGPLRAIDKLKAQRNPKLDAAIDSVQTQAFVADAKRSEPARHVMWLDGKRRLVRYEEQRQRDGAWNPVERIDLVYDAPIDNKFFAANFGPDVKVVDRSQWLADFEVEGALATAERLGIQLAVHEVLRVDDDSAFVMFTSRGTPDVVKRFGPITAENGGSMKVYGTFTLGSGGYRLANHEWVDGFTPIEVASWRRNGVEYDWVLIRHAAAWLKAGPPFPLSFIVHTRAEWESALMAEGKPTYLWNASNVVDVKLPEQADSLDAVLGDVYSQAMSMGDAAGPSAMPYLMRKPRPLTAKERDEHLALGMSREQVDSQRAIQETVRPEDIDLDTWRAEFKSYLADIDAQRQANLKK
jgi:outer membrane lipoprotein-sorting protein